MRSQYHLRLDDVSQSHNGTLEEYFRSLSVASPRASTSNSSESTYSRRHKPALPPNLSIQFERSCSPILRCPAPSPTETSFSRKDRKKKRESSLVYSKFNRDQRRQAKVRFAEDAVPHPKRKVWPPRKEGAETSNPRGATLVIPSLIQRVVNGLANFSLSDKSLEEEDSSIFVFEADSSFASSSSLGDSDSDSLPDASSSAHPMFRLPSQPSPSSSASSISPSPSWATSSLPLSSTASIIAPTPRHASRPSILDTYIDPEGKKFTSARYGKLRINFKVDDQPDHSLDGSVMRRLDRLRVARSLGQPYLRAHRRLSIPRRTVEKQVSTVDQSFATPISAHSLRNALVSVRPPTPPIRNGMPVITFEHMSSSADEEEL